MGKTFQKYLARHAPGCRSLSLLDSRVTMGAVAKGRSSMQHCPHPCSSGHPSLHVGRRVVQWDSTCVFGAEQVGWAFKGQARRSSYKGGAALAQQPRAPRGPLNLRAGFTKDTADRVEKCLEAFKVWVQSELRIPFARPSKMHSLPSGS